MARENSVTTATIRVCCILFAAVREAAGTQRLVLSLPSGCRVADARRELAQRLPQAASLLQCARFAVDGEYVAENTVLARDVELAVIPPVSGGQSRATFVDVTAEPIDLEQCMAFVRSNRCGAVVTFLGTVREFTGQRRTQYLEYEAYRDMAVRKLQELADEARVQFGLERAAVVHRLGHLPLGEISVAIAVSAPHRAQAFDGCRYIIEKLKQEVPIWKKEVWADGTEEWVHPGQ